MTASMTASISASTTNQDQDHASRLHKKYVELDFKNDPGDPQDARREGLFKRLVLHHLLAHLMYTSADWNDKINQQKCFYNFMFWYAKRLWLGKCAERGHLVFAKIRSVPRRKRSWIESYDGFSCNPGSPLGVLVREYIEVLLEPGLMGAVAEDPELLIAGILSVEVGPEIPPVAIKVEDVSEGDAMIKLEDGSG
jgi:hypothetical protein